MDSLKLDSILEIVNEEKMKRDLHDYVPCYPMLRVIGNQLYIGVMLTHVRDDVWNIDSRIKPEYWCLMDIDTFNVLEFHCTKDKDFVIGKLRKKDFTNHQKELSMFEVRKTMEYEEYFMNDIKNGELPIQKKLAHFLNSEIEVDGEKVNINDYIMANIEGDIKAKVKELVDLVVVSKYSFITFYYDCLYRNIIQEYINEKKIDDEKIKLCIEIMNQYYYGVVGIDNFFYG